MPGRFVRHAFPPDTTLVSERDIGENRIFRQGNHGVRIRAPACAGCHPEETGFRVDGIQPALCIRLDPGNVVTYRPYLPAFLLEWIRRYHHGEIGFAARA